MTVLLSLPSELLYKIIQACSPRDRCHLRATSKILNEHADPIVFRRLSLYIHPPHIAEHQIIALATRTSKACELTRDMEIIRIPNLQASEQSWPHFGRCDDLGVHLPTAISALRNITRFSWSICETDPDWLVAPLMQAIASLPQLIELEIKKFFSDNKRVPLGLFHNLSRLSVRCSQHEVPAFISQMAIAIANSPQLKNLDWVLSSYDKPLPTLSDLFSRLSAKRPLYIEHLHVSTMDATLDQVSLPHLTQLSSFGFHVHNTHTHEARSVWSSFLVNNVKLSNVEISGAIIEETMLYLSSFSGLNRLAVTYAYNACPDVFENLKSMFFTEVLPKHVNSLQALNIVNYGWACDQHNFKSILKCLELRDLHVYVNSNIPLQVFLDAAANLPELKILRISRNIMREWLVDFKPIEGLRYVEDLEINKIHYVLERVGKRPVRYRECGDEDM